MAAAGGHYPAPSTHVIWSGVQDISAFYNEVCVSKSTSGTFFMSNGWHRGYMGIQDRTPKWIIFSIWDPVEVVEIGPGCQAERFGGEGDGWKTYRCFPWRNGERYSLCVVAARHGESVLYSGGFYDPEQGRWSLIATLRSPVTSPILARPYSFVEDWLSDDGRGSHSRECCFGPAWLLQTNGTWQNCSHARGSSADSRLPPGYLNRHVYRTEDGCSIGVCIGGNGTHAFGTTLFNGSLSSSALPPALRKLPSVLLSGASPFAERLSPGRYVVTQGRQTSLGSRTAWVAGAVGLLCARCPRRARAWRRYLPIGEVDTTEPTEGAPLASSSSVCILQCAPENGAAAAPGQAPIKVGTTVWVSECSPCGNFALLHGEHRGWLPVELLQEAPVSQPIDKETMRRARLEAFEAVGSKAATAGSRSSSAVPDV